MHFAQVLDDVRCASPVVGVGDAVLGNHDRFAKPTDAPQDRVQAGRVNLPAKVGAFTGAERSGRPRPTHPRAAVVVDPDPVQRGQAAANDPALPQPVAQTRHELVDWTPGSNGLHRPDRERHAHQRIGPHSLQRAPRADVAAGSVAKQPDVAAQVPRLVRRPAALNVGLEPEDAGLVDGDPPAHHVAELTPDAVHVLGKAGHHVGVAPAALVGKPLRAGEVVQGEHWLDTRLAQRVELAAVGVQRGLVELPLARLDAGPFDRHAIGIQTQLRQQPNVVWPAVPGVTGSLGGVG